MTQRRMPTAVGALLLVPLLAGSGGLALAGAKSYRIVGVRETGKGKWEPVETLTASRSGVTFAIRCLSLEDARQAVSNALHRDLHLIRERSGELEAGHLVFVLQVDNETTKTLRFNPSEAWLQTNKGDTKIPLDYSALFMLGQRLGVDAPTTDEVAAVFFDRELMIQPGGSVRKLLVYDAPREDKYKSLEIRIAEVNVAAEPIGFLFPFRKIFED